MVLPLIFLQVLTAEFGIRIAIQLPRDSPVEGYG